MFEELDVVEFVNIDENDENGEFFHLKNGINGTIVYCYNVGPNEEPYYEIEYDIQVDGPSKLAIVPESKIRHKLYKL